MLHTLTYWTGREYRAANPDRWVRSRAQQDKINATRRRQYAESEEVREKARHMVREYARKNPLVVKAQRLKKYGVTLEWMEQGDWRRPMKRKPQINTGSRQPLSVQRRAA